MAVLNNLFNIIHSKFAFFKSKLRFFVKILMKFCRNFTNMLRMSRIFNFLKKKDPIFRKIRENFGNVEIIQKIIQHYSGVSLIISCVFWGEAKWGAQTITLTCSSGPRNLQLRTKELAARVERFDRRPIEPFELFTSEFGQNSVRIQENSSRIFRKFLKFEKFSTFSKVFSEIPRNFRQNRCKIRWKRVEN